MRLEKKIKYFIFLTQVFHFWLCETFRVIQQQFRMKERDIFWGQNILWPLLHIFRGCQDHRNPRIYAMLPRTACFGRHLSVCLSLSRITKLLLTNFDYFFRLGCGVWLVRRPDWILVLIRLIRHTQSRQWVIGSDPWPTDPPKNWPMTNYAWPVTNRFNNHEMHKIMGHGSTCTDPWPIWPSQKSDPFDPLIHDLSTHCLLWTHDVG